LILTVNTYHRGVHQGCNTSAV